MTRTAPTVAMVLAAGRGARMRPLSDVIPKPALPLAGDPVVAWPLRLAASIGVDRVVVNAWHLGDTLARAVAEVDLAGVDVVVSSEPRLMGTAGGIALARDRGLLSGSGPVLVLNGDSVLNLELDELVKRHTDSGDLVTLGLLPHLDPGRWSRVRLDARGLVADMLPPGVPAAGEVPLLYPGVMIVARAAIDALAAGPGDIPDGLWAPARRARRCGGVVVTGHWREVGTPADYLEAVLGRLDGRTVVDPAARVDLRATVREAYIGRAARVGSRAAVSQSVVAHGAVVESGARVLRSVLLGDVTIRRGDEVTGSWRAARQPDG